MLQRSREVVEISEGVVPGEPRRLFTRGTGGLTQKLGGRLTWARVNTVYVQPMTTVKGYDHLDPIEVRDCNVEMLEEYNHFSSTQI